VFGQVGFKLHKEGLHDLGLSKGFAKQPNSLGSRNALIQIKPQEPHEGQAVVDLKRGLIIGQVVEGLQNEDFEHEHGIKGGATALLPFGAAEHGGQGGTKCHPGYMSGKRFSGIPLVTQSLIASGEIKKTELAGCRHEQSSLGGKYRK